MIAGIVLIFAGILLVVYPPLLSLIVAIVLMLTGVTVISIAYQERKLKRHYRNPVIEFFVRY
jgi:drug/metabolite transporter (DMT)-like permease